MKMASDANLKLPEVEKQAVKIGLELVVKGHSAQQYTQVANIARELLGTQVHNQVKSSSVDF